MARPKRYHYPRRPLLKKSVSCLSWLLLGIVVFISPIGNIRWLGAAPLLYVFFRWHFFLRPKWNHLIQVNEEKLTIGKKVYKWDEFSEMQIERVGSDRKIRLSGQDKQHSLVIEDDILDFDSLAQDCFFYVNREVEPQTSEKTQSTRQPPPKII